MNIETLRIATQDRMGNNTGSIVITFEYHSDNRKQYEDGHEYWDEFLVLRGVEIELDEHGFNTIPLTLDDRLKDHYSELLSKHQYGLEVREFAA